MFLRSLSKTLTCFFYTKRGLLIATYIISAKMAVQEAWLRGLKWDEEFRDDLKLTTRQWAKQLPGQLPGQHPTLLSTPRGNSGRHHDSYIR